MSVPLGFKHTPETRRKISEAMKGKVRSFEHQRNLSKALRGRAGSKPGYKHKPETRRKISESLKGEKNPRWQGGRYVTAKGGYVVVLHKGKYVMEHRLVMAEKIGRPLQPEERVHHLDGNRQNNDPGNLQLFTNQSAHVKYHWQQEGGLRND